MKKYTMLLRLVQNLLRMKNAYNVYEQIKNRYNVLASADV